MDLPILKYLDVLIGLAFVMMLGCTVVAAITQAITSSFYLRAQYLRQGLADLLQQLDPTASEADCQYAAQLIQRHPLVSRSATLPGQVTTWLRRTFFKGMAWLPSGAPAETVQRHEFVQILLEWAAGEGVLGNGPGTDVPEAQRLRLEKLAENLRAILVQNGVVSAREALAGIQHHALAQERANPGLPAHLWHTAALIDACPSSFAGKVTGWYDSMAARTSQRFTLQSKLLGGLVGAFLVIALPLDSLYLMKRLSVDDAERQALVERAKDWAQKAEAEAKQPEPTPEQVSAAEIAKDYETMMRDPALSIGNLHLTRNNWFWHLPGMLLSWVLLSLGTPFWYDTLKNAVKLRSVLAQKDEKERTERQNAAPAEASQQAAGATAAGVVAVTAQPVVDDEAGEFVKTTAVG